MIHQDWKIKTRAHACCVTGQPFAEDEPFYTALFEDEGDEDGFIRRDYSVAAWKQERAALRPFSHWRSLYEPPHTEPGRREVVEKEGAEALLRRLIEEDSPLTENTRFILALMLERKKTLRETDSRSLGTARLRIYEHGKSGEVFIIRDPQLKLDQLESIQREVSDMLASRNTPPPETAAEEQPAEEQPAEEQPAEEQPAEEQPAEEQPAEEQPAEEQPAEEQPAAEQPAAEQPTAEQPAEDKPTRDDAPSPMVNPA